MVKRTTARIASGAGFLCVAALSCGTPAPDEADYLRVVVAIDPKIAVPAVIDRFTIEVVRGTRPVYSKSYDAAVIGKLPDSLIIENPSPSNDSPEKQMTSVPLLHVRLRAYKDTQLRLSNSLVLRFNGGQLKAALPMCSDCIDKNDCGEDLKCRGGQCVPDYELSTSKDDGVLDGALADCPP